MKYFQIVTFLMYPFGLIFSQGSTSDWSNIPLKSISYPSAEILGPMPKKCAIFDLYDWDAWEKRLSDSPIRFSAESQVQKVALSLPLPDGELEEFIMTTTPVMQSNLAANHPQLPEKYVSTL